MHHIRFPLDSAQTPLGSLQRSKGRGRERERGERTEGKGGEKDLTHPCRKFHWKQKHITQLGHGHSDDNNDTSY